MTISVSGALNALSCLSNRTCVYIGMKVMAITGSTLDYLTSRFNTKKQIVRIYRTRKENNIWYEDSGKYVAIKYILGI